jgi:hypothetical protein
MSANLEIPYGPNNQGAIMTAELMQKVREVKDLADRLNEKRLIITGGDTPGNLEGANTFFGVETGSGSDFDTYLGSICSALAGISDAWIARLDKGG